MPLDTQYLAVTRMTAIAIYRSMISRRYREAIQQIKVEISKARFTPKLPIELIPRLETFQVVFNDDETL